MHSLTTCDAPPHLQQASFLPGSMQPRDTWLYPWHLKHRATSTCSRMRQFTNPTLNLPSPSKPPRLNGPPQSAHRQSVYSLHSSPRSGLPSVMHSAATTPSLVSVSSRSLTSRDLFETKDLTSALVGVEHTAQHLSCLIYRIFYKARVIPQHTLLDSAEGPG